MKRFLPALIVLVALGGVTNAQSAPIKVKFEIDGEEVHRPFRIFLTADGGAVFEPPVSRSSFIFPPELSNSEGADLRFESGDFVLDYGRVHRSKFHGEMIFGVDQKPFDEEHILSQHPPDKEIKLIYYIRFSGGTGLTVTIYEQRSPPN